MIKSLDAIILQLEERLRRSESQNRIFKKALLIACNGDNVKAIECVERAINEPEG